MEPYFRAGPATLYVGDCTKVMPTLAECSLDACVTDPPYELGFMNKAWDRAGVAFDAQTWWHVYRVLKPGAHLLAFGGTRTFHRIACAVEDAGFEIRDSIAWMYGSGFPKSADVAKLIDKAEGAVRAKQTGYRPRRGSASLNPSGYNTPEWVPQVREPVTEAAKEWQGWGTALKPAFEPIVVARKPFSGTIEQNVRQHGTGALNIDGTRVPVDPDDPVNEAVWTVRPSEMRPGTVGFCSSNVDGRRIATAPPEGGRWPPNVLLDEAAAEELDRQAPALTSGGGPIRRNGDKFREVYGAFQGSEEDGIGRGDTGGASRFFPVFRYVPKPTSRERVRSEEVTHPTIKPVALMRWLARLVTPRGGLLLDPFMGSGATVEAALIEGFQVVGIDLEQSFGELVKQRIVRAGYAPLYGDDHD
jgi:site-specific DNA-methyltransferase (adenine-specific)